MYRWRTEMKTMEGYTSVSVHRHTTCVSVTCMRVIQDGVTWNKFIWWYWYSYYLTDILTGHLLCRYTVLNVPRMSLLPKRNPFLKNLLSYSLFLWIRPKAVGKQLRRLFTWTNNTRWAFCSQEHNDEPTLHLILWILAPHLLLDVYSFN